MVKQHIIELNGKRYDAVTGKMVAMAPLANSDTKPHTSPSKSSTVDGFAQRSANRSTTPKHIPAHKAERSKTLMRSAVQKPAQASHQTRNHSIQPSASAVAAHTQTKVPKAVHKSSLIRRFGDLTAAPPAAAPATTQTTKAAQTTSLQAVATATAAPASPIEAGLANATSHNQPRVKKPKVHTRVAKRLRISPRTLSAGSLVLAGVLIGAFFAYQNVPNLSMRLASSRAGLEGSLPSYQPAGFGLKGGVSYRPGQIEVAYGSNSDDRTYKITQTASSWNSETLAQNYEPLKENSNYQTVPNNGKTVYIYDGNNATWVDGGVWYRIEGDSKLSSDQLLNVAESL